MTAGVALCAPGMIPKWNGKGDYFGYEYKCCPATNNCTRSKCVSPNLPVMSKIRHHRFKFSCCAVGWLYKEYLRHIVYRNVKITQYFAFPTLGLSVLWFVLSAVYLIMWARSPHWLLGRRRAASRWLLSTIVGLLRGLDADRESDTMLSIKHLLGNRHFAVGHDNYRWLPDGGTAVFHSLKGLARVRLEQIAAAGERDIYRGLGLEDELGDVGRHTGTWTASVRMDSPKLLGQALWDGVKRKPDPEACYAVGLMLLSSAVDAEFQRLSHKIAQATQGECKSAPPKSFPRMANKLLAAEDHLWELPDPRSALNIDLCRNGVTYSSAEQLHAGFLAFTERFPVLRMKNNLRSEFDAEHKSFGYRAILVNMLFEPDSGPDGQQITWNDLFDLPSTQEAWDEIRTAEQGCSAARFDEVFVDLLRSAYGTRPVRFVVESQFILQEYLEMRKNSHFW